MAYAITMHRLRFRIRFRNRNSRIATRESQLANHNSRMLICTTNESNAASASASALAVRDRLRPIRLSSSRGLASDVHRREGTTLACAILQIAYKSESTAPHISHYSSLALPSLTKLLSVFSRLQIGVAETYSKPE